MAGQEVTGFTFLETADPSWHRSVLRTLAADYPDVALAVWSDTIGRNAVDAVARRAGACPGDDCTGCGDSACVARTADGGNA